MNVASNIFLYVVKKRDLANRKVADSLKKSLKLHPLRATSLTPRFTADILRERRKPLQFGPKVPDKCNALHIFTFACGQNQLPVNSPFSPGKRPYEVHCLFLKHLSQCPPAPAFPESDRWLQVLPAFPP